MTTLSVSAENKDPGLPDIDGLTAEGFWDLETFPEIPRLKRLRREILRSKYHVCLQKASHMTRFVKGYDHVDPITRIAARLHYTFYRRALVKASRGIPQKRWQVRLGNMLNKLFMKRRRLTPARSRIMFAKALEYTLRRIDLKVYDYELVVGNPSSYRVGAPIHPDLGGLLMLPEIDSIGSREQNPIHIGKDEIDELKEEIFPFWFNRSVLACFPLYANDPELFNTILDGSFFVLTQFAGISHVTPDYPAVIKLGFNGIKQKIADRMAEVEYELGSMGPIPAKPARRDPRVESLREKRAFYQAAMIVADAAIDYGKRWCAFLRESAEKSSDAARKRELLDLSHMFRRIPAEPATTFHEAVQAVFITHTILHQESFQHGVSFGRMDQYLYPYYRKDIDEGRLTRFRAAEIVGSFLCKAGELLPLFFEKATEYFSGLSSASGITLGGLKEEGRDGTNELTYLILLSYDQVRLRQPNLHARVHEGSDKTFLDLCFEVLKKGGGLPAFFNDETVIPALKNVGFSGDDAGDYAIVGCVEWGCPYKSFPAAGAIFVNLASALHLALHDGEWKDRRLGPSTGHPGELTTMDEIVEAFRAQLRYLLFRATSGNNAVEKAHALHRPTPFLSVIVEGCIEKGADVTQGGAVYNSTGCQAVGIADVVDSLVALEQVVFLGKRETLAGFVRIVDSNFKNSRELRDYLMNRISKYGENTGRADYYLKKISSICTDEILKFRNPRGGKYLPGFWTMTTHQGFGRRMPALPSGRLAGEPLANGISPCNGWDSQGPTASMSAAAHFDGSVLGNGYALNQKINLDFLAGREGNLLLEWLIKGFFKKGGMQVQFNIVDPDTLIDAREHPDRYPDLVVRVSGYSAYFNDLTESMKDELIKRTLHSPAQECCWL